MPILVYWTYTNYLSDMKNGFAYHFNSNQERLHSCTNIGDDVFVVSQIGNGFEAEVHLLAHFVVKSKEFNPSTYKYGGYRILADEEKSRYFSPDARPITSLLLNMGLIKPLPLDLKSGYGQSLQTIREISQADAQSLFNFANMLSVIS